jgi:chaperonin GroES
MNVDVTRDRVLIKRIVNEAKTDGGIIFTYTGEEHKFEGTVVAKGPGRTTDDDVIIPIDVEIGDKIIYSQEAGITVKVEGTEYLMIKESDIICVVAEEE